jgi:allantoin racemase
MRLLIVNPNTSVDFTRKIDATAMACASAGTVIVAVNPSVGPRSIESVYDEVLSAAPSLELALLLAGEADAIVAACYSDHPLIAALREALDVPVLGIAEASMQVALMLGRTFSIVTTNDAWHALLWDAVKRYGFADRCASVRTTGMPVLALEGGGADLESMIAEQARMAVQVDGAEVVCLGCAGMTGLDERLQAELHVPVLDGVKCAVKLAEALVGLGARTSKRRAYATPSSKPLDGLPDLFQRCGS